MRAHIIFMKHSILIGLTFRNERFITHSKSNVAMNAMHTIYLNSSDYANLITNEIIFLLLTHLNLLMFVLSKIESTCVSNRLDLTENNHLLRDQLILQFSCVLCAAENPHWNMSSVYAGARLQFALGSAQSVYS